MYVPKTSQLLVYILLLVFFQSCSTLPTSKENVGDASPTQETKAKTKIPAASWIGVNIQLPKKPKQFAYK